MGLYKKDEIHRIATGDGMEVWESDGSPSINETIGVARNSTDIVHIIINGYEAPIVFPVGVTDPKAASANIKKMMEDIGFTWDTDELEGVIASGWKLKPVKNSVETCIAKVVEELDRILDHANAS